MKSVEKQNTLDTKLFQIFSRGKCLTGLKKGV